MDNKSRLTQQQTFPWGPDETFGPQGSEDAADVSAVPEREHQAPIPGLEKYVRSIPDREGALA